MQVLYKRTKASSEQMAEVSPFLELRRMADIEEQKRHRAEHGSSSGSGGGDSSSEESLDSEGDRDSDSGEAEGSALLRKVKVVPTGADGKKALRAEREARRQAQAESLSALKKRQVENNEAKAVMNSFYETMGISAEPDDADWLKLSHHDHNAGETRDVGRVLLGISLLSTAKAEEMENGQGRSDPNMHPKLASPTGRMAFSTNPFVLLKGLFMNKYILMCACCMCCVGV